MSVLNHLAAGAASNSHQNTESTDQRERENLGPHSSPRSPRTELQAVAPHP